MFYSENNTDCLIIGSGICGLIAANRLSEAGFSVLLLDKGRGSGGRLATRRVRWEEGPEGVVDYGAPHFSVQTPVVQALAHDWARARVIKAWEDDTPDKINKKYIGLQGMRGIAKHLAGNLDIRQSERVVSLAQNSHWSATTEKGNRYQSPALILTAPMPQALILLDENQIKLEPTARKLLNQIKYDPCLAVFGILESSSKLEIPGTFFIKEGVIKWIADHQKRRISEIPTYTALMSAKFSQETWEMPEEQIISRLLPEIEKLLGTNLKTFQMHRWKYANAQNTFSHPFYLQKHPLRLILAGDSFVSGGVEGAILSGIAAADALIKNYPK